MDKLQMLRLAKEWAMEGGHSMMEFIDEVNKRSNGLFKGEYESPSKEFEAAVMYFGSSCLSCELCGRVHFSSFSAMDFDEGELEELRRKAVESPDRYVDWGDASVAGARIDGRQAVVGCPCNRLSHFEEWIWGHRYIILKYLKAVAERDKRDADDFLKEVESVGEVD